MRASDYKDANHREWLRHQRASSRIRATYQEIREDDGKIDRIVAEEERAHSRQFELHALATRG